MVRLTRWRCRLAVPIAVVVGAVGFWLLRPLLDGFAVAALPVGFVVFLLLQQRICRVPWVFDFRPPILVLRSFTDERSKLGDALQHTGFMTGIGRNPYIWQLTEALWDWCRVVLLQEEANDAGLGMTAVILDPAGDWQNVVVDVGRRAWLVLVFPASTPSSIRELELLRDNGLLASTVVFMPPTASPASRLFQSIMGHGALSRADHCNDWEQIRRDLAPHGFALPPYEARGMLYVPDSMFSIDRALDLAHCDYSWHRLQELVPGPGVAGEPLWNTVCCGRAFEADDPGRVRGGVAAGFGCPPGWLVMHDRDGFTAVAASRARALGLHVVGDGETPDVAGTPGQGEARS